MGKLILVSGENNSGKSFFAENLVAGLPGKRYYIATMIPITEDNRIRIEKHRKQRENMNFQTMEIPYCLNDAKIDEDSVVLLEDVSNLLANNIFEKNKSYEDVYEDIMALLEKCRVMAAVTISGLKNEGYDEETASYIKSLDEINRKLYEKAWAAVTMSEGKAKYIKGENYDAY